MFKFVADAKWRLMCFLMVCLATGLTGPTAKAQEAKRAKKKPKVRPPFQWVNPLQRRLPDVQHATFRSKSMQCDVGYCIYLPPAYQDKKYQQTRFPVVYYLHGGRPGNETKSVGLTKYLREYMSQEGATQIIYVFVNGGPVSHYNLPERKHAMGEDVFVKELIPHIDATYRTIADRSGRGLEGFSQGGRGTTRIMFKHSRLFSSAAPGGAGYATEKRISENGGAESETLVFAPGYNTWDLARAYARSKAPRLRILIHVGTKGFNYENNLEYMKFLQSLQVSFKKVVVAGAPHSADKIYYAAGKQIYDFHSQNFAK